MGMPMINYRLCLLPDIQIVAGLVVPYIILYSSVFVVRILRLLKCLERLFYRMKVAL